MSCEVEAEPVAQQAQRQRACVRAWHPCIGKPIGKLCMRMHDDAEVRNLSLSRACTCRWNPDGRQRIFAIRSQAAARPCHRHDACALHTSMHTLSILCASSKTTTHSFSSSRDTMLDTCMHAYCFADTAKNGCQLQTAISWQSNEVPCLGDRILGFLMEPQ